MGPSLARILALCFNANWRYLYHRTVPLLPPPLLQCTPATNPTKLEWCNNHLHVLKFVTLRSTVPRNLTSSCLLWHEVTRITAGRVASPMPGYPAFCSTVMVVCFSWVSVTMLVVECLVNGNNVHWIIIRNVRDSVLTVVAFCWLYSVSIFCSLWFVSSSSSWMFCVCCFCISNFSCSNSAILSFN